MKKRLLSAFLAVMMVLTMAPVAFAAEGETTSEPVAQVDGTDYATLAEAIAAADGKTLTLLKDVNGQIVIPKGKTVTLDLNGKTMTNTGTTLYNSGTLVVKDSSANKSGKIVSTGNVGIGVNHNSTTTIEYANIEAQEGAVITGYATGATITIKDGVFKALDNAVVAGNGNKTDENTEGHPVRYNANNITIDGGTFIGNIRSSGYIACGIYAPWKDIITVNGGNFTVNNGIGIVARAGQVTVNGGTFTCNGSAKGGVGDKKFDMDAAQCVYFDASNPAYPAYNSATDYIKLQGGTFSSDVSAYVAKGYVQNENGTVERLGETNAVAKIGDTYYKTLADAYAALPRNAGTDSEPTTITVLKDSEGKAIGSDSDKGMNYVIDFGGHTYTVGKPAVGSTGTETQGLRVLKGSKAVFKNGTLKAVNYPDMKMPVHTYGDVTFEDFTVDATEDSYAQIAYEIDNGSLNMIGNSSILAYPGKIGLYVSFWPRGGYTDGTTVNIDTTGKITGKMVYEWDDKADTAEQQKENKAVLNIKNGNFDITNIQTLFTSSLPSNLKVPKIYISGGYFTVDPSAYCVTGKTGVPSNRTDEYAWTVGKKSETKAEVATDKPTVVTKVTATTDEDKTLLEATKTALSSTKVEGNGIATAAAVVANNNTVTADTGVVSQLKEATKDNAVTAENTNIVIQTYMDMTITGVDASSEKKTITVDIQPMYRTVATTADVKNGDEIVLKGDESKVVNAVQIGNPQKLVVSGETTVSIQLPNGFVTDETAKIFVQHKGYEYEATVTKDNTGVYTATFTNPHGFSPFTISMTSQAVAQIGETKYTSLQDAVNAVENNGTIEIVGGNKDYTATISGSSKTIKVKNSLTNGNIKVTVNGESKTIEPSKDATFTYTKPSSGGSSGGSSSGKTTYKVTTSAVNNGGVNASPSSAEKGAAITITLSPDKGYKLDKLTVTDGSGKTVSTVKKSDTVYTFTMPASAVKVGVSYVKATETPSETKFNDVSANDWFASAVDYVTGKGMMNGTADNTFSPKANTTRGMVVTVLYRLENQPSTSAASFTDVASGAYYANAVAWANANGIVSGYGSGKFGPNDKVTREQLAAILYRYAQYKKYDVSVGEDTNILSYDDAQSISSYAIPAIQWACGAGVVTGKSGSKLDPKGNATRAEVAAMLMRFCENVK